MRNVLSKCAMIAIGAMSSGCLSTSVERGTEPTVNLEIDASIERLADTLVRAAEVRIDVSAMRLCVHEFQGSTAEQVYGHWVKQQGLELSSVGAALEHEFMVALSSRLHLLDSSLAGPGAPRLHADPLEAVADHVGATHALVGSFMRRDDQLAVSVRIVDARSLLIVAAARGVVPFAPLAELGPLAMHSRAPAMPTAPQETAAEIDVASGPVEPPIAEVVEGPTAPGPARPRIRKPGLSRVPEENLVPVDGPAALRRRVVPVARDGP